ncbi:MAG: hypothetical protein QME66_10445 [Candidatus Eisenbacteria bacterium]|nr:hypothetical protein [Candidatus Eisenbacteria bacterium]
MLRKFLLALAVVLFVFLAGVPIMWNTFVGVLGRGRVCPAPLDACPSVEDVSTEDPPTSPTKSWPSEDRTGSEPEVFELFEELGESDAYDDPDEDSEARRRDGLDAEGADDDEDEP